jgi:nicotinamidase-related amidase/type 1 glutamine amidotransferase
MRATLLSLWAGIVTLGSVHVTTAADSGGSAPIRLTARTRDEAGALHREVLDLDPARCAVVVVDMWDRHWCATFTSRVGNLVPRMNAALTAARQLGMTVVHAPSDVLDFYRDAPQREAMRAVPEHPEPEPVGFDAPPPPPPTDCCECGPDQPCREKFKAWSRQHAELVIAEHDLIGDCNDGRELLNLCAARGIDTLLYMGVASNMCVQYRSMGIRNMQRYGLRILVAADLVEAITSNGLDAEGNKDLNFTPAGGTARVQRHIEQYLAPTFESRQLLSAAAGDGAGHDRRPHVVFVAAEREYDSRNTLPAFAKRYLHDDFRCTFLEATGPEGSGRDEIPGLQALQDADLLVLSARRRSLPVAHMDHLERYMRAGKPLVALRVSIVAFQTGKDPLPGHVVWDRFDREVIGGNYRGYHPDARTTGSEVWIAPESVGHPIVQGVESRFHSPMWIYYQQPLADTATVLLMGRWSEYEAQEPVAWTNNYQGGRVFYTTLGHPGDFQIEAFNRLLLNAVRWAVEAE